VHFSKESNSIGLSFTSPFSDKTAGVICLETLRLLDRFPRNPLNDIQCRNSDFSEPVESEYLPNKAWEKHSGLLKFLNTFKCSTFRLNFVALRDFRFCERLTNFPSISKKFDHLTFQLFNIQSSFKSLHFHVAISSIETKN
jgi:hypothetical protein